MATKPDLIVGIDFGMTCTGVAYSNVSRGDTVKSIQRWPGRGNANENKVPTILCYQRHNQSGPSSWGFTSENRQEQTSPDVLYIDWFKTFLDEKVLKAAQAKDAENSPKSIHEVERWYIDYLRHLYQHIESRLRSEINQPKTWETANIEFIFSVPTTWAPNPTVERFRSVVTRAGFGQLHNHSIAMGLTEAEAAAVSAMVDTPGLFAESETLLVCDVGGGTTDLSVLRVTDVASGSLSLKQLDVVVGRNIGAVMIDSSFEDAMAAKLQSADQSAPLEIDVDDAAWLISRSREYQSIKCDLGSPDDPIYFSVTIPGLDPSYENEQAMIARGCLKCKTQELRDLFDIQIERLFNLLDKQIAAFQNMFPGEQISHLILSGGLGNNLHVQKRLNERYAFGASTFQCARSIRVSVAADPQLTVCKGIVADRQRKLSSGKAVLGWRCSRSSFGTICRILYDSNNPDHIGRVPVLDPLNGKSYIPNAITWFIKKGEAVNVDTPICQAFTRKLDVVNPKRMFPTTIVTSNMDKDFLPLQVKEGADILCEVKSNLSGISETRFKLKNRHWWNLGKPYRRCKFTVQVIIGPADINFELYFEGQKLSQDSPISVEWMGTTEPPTIVDTDEAASSSPAISRSRGLGAKHISLGYNSTSISTASIVGRPIGSPR